MKRVFAKEQYCVGCGVCQVHCVVAHSDYKNDIVKAFTKQNPRPLPRIIVEENRPISFGLQCRHCEE
ncbi:MAG TPA: 4Fe-4S ferredoxin, partial [Verrucomicrobiae bacterium]|nr:4Fe-4S ferredoxin [Verrucomicrobiae bacterium]